MTTVHERRGQAVPERLCECGCAECAADRCELECLERPRYFCGQLLSDRDLEAMAKWVEGRLRRVRLRDGWGVVCGLDVRCDPANPSGVIVTRGYAVGCCGDDVVLCADEAIDLGPCCRPEDPQGCLDVRVGEELRELPETCIVDLAVRARGVPTAAQPALVRTACTEVPVCEPSRVRESAELIPTCVTEGEDPRAVAVTAWLDRWTRTLDPAPLTRAGLGQELRLRPPHRFGFLRRWAADEEQDLAGLWFWLVQDRRAALLACPCPDCATDRPVPLARIRLSRAGAAGHMVESVDPAPPYRRPFGDRDDCLPARPGEHNLADLLWRDLGEVCLELAARGVPVAAWRAADPATVDEDVLRRPPLVPCDRAVAIHHLAENPLGFGGRVIGFTLADGDEEDSNEDVAEAVHAEATPEPPAEPGVDQVDEIGPKRASALRRAGVGTAAALAALRPEQVDELLPGLMRGVSARLVQNARRLVGEPGRDAAEESSGRSLFDQDEATAGHEASS